MGSRTLLSAPSRCMAVAFEVLAEERGEAGESSLGEEK